MGYNQLIQELQKKQDKLVSISKTWIKTHPNTFSFYFTLFLYGFLGFYLMVFFDNPLHVAHFFLYSHKFFSVVLIFLLSFGVIMGIKIGKLMEKINNGKT